MERQTETHIDTTCAYCGVGCGVRATVRDDQLIAVEGDQAHPANQGSLCIKGSSLHETLGNHGRLLHPRIAGQDVSWDIAIGEVARRLRETSERYGPESIAFYLSGQLLTEDYYVANKLAKGFLGTGHVDTNSRLCMSSAVAAHKRAFGADLVPGNYEDLELADLLILTGSNAAWTHPILYRRMAAAKERNPNLRVVVIDPRRTATCDLADLHLQIAPGSDGFLFTGLLAWLERIGALDHAFIDAHTLQLDEALNAALPCTVERVADTCAIDPALLLRFFGWFTETERVVTFFSQGINQSTRGTDQGNAIINCHLATGRIGKPGAGPFSITGQPNAMGGREVGGLANMLAAHMDYTPENRQLVSEFWQTDTLSNGPGHKAVDLFDAVARGRIRAIWIMGTNPVVSMPDADRVRAALQACDTVIVSDCIAETDTAACADILLPAQGWAEKSGTVTNSERRISRQRALIPAPGEAQPDWWILTQVAQALGYADAFAYRQPRDIFVEHAALSGYRNDGARFFDISALSGLDDAAYDRLTPVQWPVTAAQPHGTERLFADGRFATEDGRARFVAVSPALPKQKTDPRYPLVLNTGRERDQWHTMTRTGRTQRLLSHAAAPTVRLHPGLARERGIADGDLVEIHGARGQVRMLAELDAGVSGNSLFAPIHWNSQFSGAARIGATIAALTDPHSGQPELKCTPADIRKVDVHGWAVLASRAPLDLDGFEFWCAVPQAGMEARVYLVALGADHNWADWLGARDLALDSEFSRSDHAAPLEYRLVGMQEARVAFALFSAAQRERLPGLDWMGTLFGEGLDGPGLQSLAGPSAGELASGRKICSCHQVGENDIIAAVRAGCASVESLGSQLRCGTNCGSCIPELKMLINQNLQAGAA